MDKGSFSKFYEEVVQKLVIEICANNPSIGYVNNFGGLFEEYLNQKTLLKMVIGKKSDEDNKEDEDNKLLDRHKVSACITASVIKVRLLHDTGTDDIDFSYSIHKSNRVNEKLAFLSGLGSLMSYMVADNPDSPLFTKDRFILPETRYNKTSSYLDSIIRALYYSGVMSNINLLLISNIFFLLEEYHKKCSSPVIDNDVPR